MNKINNMEHPNAKKHQLVSFIKSSIRLVGYVFLFYNMGIAASLLIISEVVGIYEELV